MGDAQRRIGGGERHDCLAGPHAEQEPADEVARAADDQRPDGGVQNGRDRAVQVRNRVPCRMCSAHPSRTPATTPGSRIWANVPYHPVSDSDPASSAMKPRKSAAQASPHTPPIARRTAADRVLRGRDRIDERVHACPSRNDATPWSVRSVAHLSALLRGGTHTLRTLGP